jgi:hypothetical protein
MRYTKKNWLRTLMIVVLGASFCVAASDVFGSGGAVGLGQQLGRMTRSRNKESPPEQRVDRVPLKHGLWEQTIFQGLQAVNGEAGQGLMCPERYALSPFPSFTSTEDLGRVLPQELELTDDVWRLADGKYRVNGAITTTRGGAVVYEHLIAVHDDEHYDDVVIVTLYADTHPVKHVHTGSGHWLAPCPAQGK